MSAPWSSPDADPLADIREFMARAEQQPLRPFAVLAPPPLGCPECGTALPSCHQQYGRSHCGQHDTQICSWAWSL